MRWWAELDSNQRRQSQQIYSLPPLAAWVSARFLKEECALKAGGRLLQMDSLLCLNLFAGSGQGLAAAAGLAGAGAVW